MKKYTSWIIVLVAVALIIGAMVWYSDQPGQLDQFATCIKNSGATFYGAFWCPHCAAEKALFGKSVDKLPYVECSTPDGKSQDQVCNDAGIQGYPTWQFAGGTTTRQEGVLTLEQLASSTGCSING